MKTLFLIDGAAGTGKSDMLEYLGEKYSGRHQVAVIQKFTTRKHRSEEINRNLSLDLRFVAADEFSKLKATPGFYCYVYGDGSYGFHGSQIEEAFKTHQQVVIIVRDRATIQQLVEDYPQFRTIPVFIYTDREQCKKRLRSDGYSAEAVKFRLGRQHLAWNDYLKHSRLYEEVIVNNSNRTDFHRLIDYLVQKYSVENESQEVLVISNSEQFPLLTPLIGFKKAIQSHAENYSHNVFLMMKFRDNNKLVSEFIKNELHENGLTGVRADDPEWNITKNLYNPLAVLYCCKYGIALFDEPEEGNSFSPNVAYELSMMHMQGKNCLILRHELLPSMPFDLIAELHQSYSKDLQLRRIIRNWLAGILK
jgi:guanylate kinase